jgi:hypothetical protein
MQRRAAAVSVALFLLLAAGSYTLIGAAEQPALDIEEENVAYTVSEGDIESIAGTEYNFSSVSEGSATATWFNESARYTTTWSEGDNVTYRGTNYSVWIPNRSDPAEFELREVQTVDKPTVEQNGTTYVVLEDGQNRTLVPREEYLPDPMHWRFREGDTIDYEGNDNETTVASVTESEVVIEWFAPDTFEKSFSEGENTTIGETAYLAHFETQNGGAVLELTTAYSDYQEDVDAQETFHERMNGLWGIVILGSLAAALLVMLAYMPSRY